MPLSDVHANRAVLTSNMDSIELVWTYEPSNAAVNKVECLYLSNPIQRVYTISIPTNEKLVGDRYLRRISHLIRDGFFNLTLKHPTREDVGFYECEFHSEGAKLRKAKVSLVCKFVNFVFKCKLELLL